MSYVVLARRYRPQVFGDLVGQAHVTGTLQNAILQKRTAHAYLFTGPRGVGKTSAARILARAIRCLDLQKNGDPCNTCEACKGALEGTSMDILEIDAASNTGVDNIRDLRENVEYMATVGKYRVYVIDEVHMLSTAAFNALLKTLEEPPPHVIFIFATTELHKVLPTIQSRCQRFDFKKITPAVMTEKLTEICQAEKISIDESSLRTIVVESEGCMRDAESLLDQAIALCGKEIKISKLEAMLSLLDRSSFITLLTTIGDHDPGKALELTGQMFSKGIDAKILLNRLVDFFADLHFRAFTGKSRNPDVDMDPLMESLLKKLSIDEIIRALDLSLKTQSQLGGSVNTLLTVESMIAKLCLQRPVAFAGQSVAPSPQQSATQFTGTSASAAARPMTSSQERPSERARNVDSTVPNHPTSASQSASTSLVSPTPSPESSGGDSLSILENYIRNKKPAWTPVLQSVLHIERDGEILKVKAKADFAGKRLASADGIEVLKIAYKVQKPIVTLEQQSSAPSHNPNDTHERMKQKHVMAKEHDAVKSALSIFNATITETKVLDDDKK